MSTVSSTSSLTLDLPPSCIAFCPSRPQLFVVGTYFLHPRDARDENASRTEDKVDDDEADSDRPSASVQDSPKDEEQKRTGSLILFRIDRNDKM